MRCSDLTILPLRKDDSPLSPTAIKILWIVVSALFSVVIAMTAGILAVASGETLIRGFLYGGGAFTGAMILSITVLNAVDVL